MFLRVIIFAIVIHSWPGLCTKIVIQTPLGKIQGIIQNSRKGNDFYSFRGVRYAEPPTGENRFRLAIPVKPWNGTMDATKDGFLCPQNKQSHSLMSEDCLILNVYTRSLQGLLPVMFYVHGGSFAHGGSHSELFWNPRYLMDKDIVLITFNYRLGILGCISTGSKEAPGNLGLKDQVLALRWVRDNIKYFGGDSNQVTLWGHSGGSVMASLHIVSPMSHGLFHRAIIMSGTATSHYQYPIKNNTKNTARAFQCPIEDQKLLVNCLRKIPWEKLIKSIPDVVDWFYEIEGNFGQQRFLEDDPSFLLAQGRFAKIPIIAGITKDEGEPFVNLLFNYTTIINELNNDFYKNAPKILLYNETLTSVTKILKSAYLGNGRITIKNLNSFGKLYSDAIVGHEMHRFVNLARKFTDVFYYRQDFQGRYSWTYRSDGKPYGVNHGDDLLYLFIYKSRGPMFTENDPENVMVETLTALFTTFAQTGNPNNCTNPWTSNIKWEASNKNRVKMLYINTQSVLGPEAYPRRMNLWNNLFPVPGSVWSV